MPPLILRKPTMSDAQALFTWRNDPDTCRFSRDTNPAEWAGHISWLMMRVCGVEDEFYQVAMNDMGVSVGLVWFTTGAHGIREVHYRVDPNYRRQGIGTQMVREFTQRYARGQFVCPIIEGNVASEKLAARLGLSPDEREPVAPGDDRILVIWG